MRFPKVLLVSITAAGLVGCSNAAGPSATMSPGSSVKAQPAAEQTGPVVPNAKAGARAAAAHFDGLYVAGRFAASWDLLVPQVKRQVSLGLWIKVHHSCQPASTTVTRVIKAVTVFGNAAIVSEAISRGRPKNRKAEEVFSYVDGRWRFSPANLSVYHHGSAAADIAAAKAAGYCTTWKSF